MDVSGDGGGGNTEETREWSLSDPDMWHIGRASIVGQHASRKLFLWKSVLF